MKMKYLSLAILLTAGIGLGACNDDRIATSSVTPGLSVSNQIEGLAITSGEYTFKEVNTGTETKVSYGSLPFELNDGLYNVTFIGKGKYAYNAENVEVNIQGTQQNVQVSGGSCNLSIPVYVQNSGADFVIAEIFGIGTLTPENKQYNGDQYIRIYNNSDKTLYADGLALLESKFMTTSKYNYTPDIMNEAFAVQVVAVIPGNGQEHPVEPGQSIILCDNAMNHKEANPNSIDLSKADFEWYTQSTSSSNPDMDNPDVPNLEMYYNYTKSIWLLAKKGNRAYAIGRIPSSVGKDNYIKDYVYKYTYMINEGLSSKEQTCYQFPNEWIIDAVNIGPVNSYVWNITAPVLDMGHTYFGETDATTENAGKSIIRKVAYKDGDREVLQDTNNSSIDFTPSTSPSIK